MKRPPSNHEYRDRQMANLPRDGGGGKGATSTFLGSKPGLSTAVGAECSSSCGASVLRSSVRQLLSRPTPGPARRGGAGLELVPGRGRARLRGRARRAPRRRPPRARRGPRALPAPVRGRDRAARPPPRGAGRRARRLLRRLHAPAPRAAGRRERRIVQRARLSIKARGRRDAVKATSLLAVLRRRTFPDVPGARARRFSSSELGQESFEKIAGSRPRLVFDPDPQRVPVASFTEKAASLDRRSLDEREVQQLWDSVRAEALRRGADAHTAEDVAQEAWLRAVREPPEERGRLRGWLHVVVVRLLRETRSRARNRLLRELAVARDERVPSSGVSETTALMRHFAELDELHQVVIRLRFFEDLEVDEIAARLGLHPEAVRSRLKRGLARLRARLEPAPERRGRLGLVLGWFLRRLWNLA